MALGQQRLLTYADYVALPDDGKRYALINGVLVRDAVSDLLAPAVCD